MDYSDFMPYIDVKGGLARLMNNPKFYARMLKTYLASMNMDYYDEMAKYLAAGEFETAREKIHAFKGTSSNLSIAKNYDISRDLEAIAKEHGDYAAKLEELRVSMEATIPEINRLIALFEGA